MLSTNNLARTVQTETAAIGAGDASRERGYIQVLGPARVIPAITQPVAASGELTYLARRLLAALTMWANDEVSLERLCDLIWFDRCPGPIHPVRALKDLLRRVEVSLSGAAGPMIIRNDRHVRLEVSTYQVDANHFAQLVREVELRSPPEQDALVSAALGLWKGDPYEELADSVQARPEIERLHRLHRDAVARHHAARVAGPPDYTEVAELTGLVTRWPDDGRLRRQLVVALYRLGRRRSALQVIQESRRSPLRGDADHQMISVLERLVLDQDPMLEQTEWLASLLV